MENNVQLILLTVGGAGLSVLFEFVPGFKGWYTPKTSQVKSLIMLILLTVGAVGVFALSCYSPYEVLSCSQAGAWELATAWILAITANQGVHRLTKGLKKPS